MNERLQSQIAEFASFLDEARMAELQPLFDAISATYWELTDAKQRAEVVLASTTQQYQQQTGELQKEINANNEAIESLKQTLSTLQPRVFDGPEMTPSSDGAKEVVRLANYLRSMVISHRQALELVANQEARAEELSRQLERFKVAVDSAADYITMLSPDLRVVYANPSVKRRTGYSLAEGKYIYDQWWSKMPRDEVERLHAMLVDTSHDRNQFSYEVTGSSQSGEQFVMAVHSTTIRDKNNQVALILDISRDISKERSLEKLKDEFVSIASHELRTPMTVIRGYAQILESEKAGPLNEKQKSYLSRMSKNTQMLIELVGDMLSLGKLEANKLTFDLSPLSIKSCVDAAAEKFKDMYAEKHITLTADADDESVMIDPDRMDQVLTNLLSNAFKFTPAGGTVGIFAQTLPSDTTKVVVAVEDTGIGIPHAARDALFKKFSQVDNVLQRQAGGTGLGLAICKEIVEKMGGKIWVEDRQAGSGTRFCFTIPKAVASKVESKQTGGNIQEERAV